MEKFADFILKKRNVLFSILVIFAVICMYLTTLVVVNLDMTEYLPEDSRVRAALYVMDEEFGYLNPSPLYVMFEGLTVDEQLEVYEQLISFSGVAEVRFDSASEFYVRDEYTLYLLTLVQGLTNAQEYEVVTDLLTTFSDFTLYMSGAVEGVDIDLNMMLITVPTVIILTLILFAMCRSWFEPIIFFINIGIAILINMGTNVIFGSVSDITQMIAGLLQVALSMDYSIIFLNRYRQEKEAMAVEDHKLAMKNTIKNSFSTISGISFTTIVGMLMLAFMSFTIGADIGFVIAKGVFISLICVFVVMPALILWFDKLIDKTAKPVLTLKMGGVGRFSYKARYVVGVCFVALVSVAFVLQNRVVVTYSEVDYDPVHQVFDLNNTFVLLYEHVDEVNMGEFMMELMENTKVIEIQSYGILQGQGLDESLLATLRPMFVSTHFSRMMITTTFDFESAETFAFIDQMIETLDALLEGRFYLLGTSVMPHEMSQNFPRESNFITILTTIAFFIVVAVSFKSMAVSIILTITIQGAVFITMGVAYFQEGGIMFLPLIIAQVLLKSRVIDYGILYTANYIEARREHGVKQAIITALNNSIDTILTSGLIIVLITFVVGLVFRNVNIAISEILLLIAQGCFIGVMLSIFVLPSLIAVLDRFVVKAKRSGH